MKRQPWYGSTALTSMLLLVLSAGAAAQTKTDQPSPAVVSQTATSAPKTTESKSQAPSSATQLTPQQAQLQAEIEKLYQLAQDLKAAVAKSNKDTLSIDVIKKADAVEKAAKGLKDQMKNPQQTTSSH